MNKQELEELEDEELDEIVFFIINKRQRYVGESQDFCNNPSNIMPIAIKNNINILNPFWWDGDGRNWLILDPTHEIESKHKNPYRAICIVFILMEGEE